MSERMAVMAPARLPAEAMDFMVLMQKTSNAIAGSTRDEQKDSFFGKKSTPSFPMGKQIENRLSHSVLWQTLEPKRKGWG